MKRAFARRIYVCMVLINRVRGTTILQRKAETVRNQTTAKFPIVALNERNHHAVLICNGKISGIAVRRWSAGRHSEGCFINVYQLAPARGVGLRQQTLDRIVVERRVGVVPGTVFIGKFLRLYYEMPKIGVVATQFAKRKGF